MTVRVADQVSTENRWTAIHCYVPRSLQTDYLLHCVVPALERNSVSDFFFLRYWKGGPHLRIRIKNPCSTIIKSLQRELERAMPDYDESLRKEYQFEAGYQEQLALLEGENTERIRGVGTVEIRSYEPELEKYGGERGIKIAERLFCESSREVVRILESQDSREPIGQAMGVMISSLRGCQLTLAEISEFLDRHIEWWMPYVPNEFIAHWDRVRSHSNESVKRYVQHCWNVSESTSFFGVYRKALIASVDDNESPSGEGGFSGSVPSATHARNGDAAFLTCVSHYIHTTNNRLGLIPSSEALTAFLLRHAFSDLMREDELLEKV